MGRPKKDGWYDYKDKQGKYSYYVKVVYVLDATGKRKRRPIRGKTKDELEAKVANALESSCDGKTVSEITVGQWCDRWTEKILPKTVKDATLTYYKYMLRYLTDVIKAKKMAELTPIDLQDLFRDLLAHGARRTGKRLSTTTVRGVRATLISACDSAIDNGLITVNPAKKTKPPLQDDKKEITFLTMEEMRRLIAVAESGEYYDRLDLALQDIGSRYLIRQWAVLIHLELVSGMRRGEIFGITFGNMDLDSGIVRVENNLQHGVLKSPKTKNSKRIIPINKDTVTKLRDWKQYQEQYASEVGDKFNNVLNLVFTNAFGKPVNYDNFRCRYFNRMVRKAGLPETITFHSLRHSVASNLLQVTDEKTVSRLLGHSSVSFTLQTYVHVLPDAERKAVDAMGAILAETASDDNTLASEDKK